MRVLRKILILSSLLAVGGGLLFVSFFLQELGTSDIPERVKTLGLTLPLEDPILIISTEKMTLSLFEGENLIKRFDVGFGREHVGRTVAGATPLGEFRIVRKFRRQGILSRGSRFLEIDYPSPEIAETAYAADLIDASDMERILAAHASGSPIPGDTALGGPIGIQGNFFSFKSRHCTDGSVALSNSEINELFEVVPIGTPVLIQR